MPPIIIGKSHVESLTDERRFKNHEMKCRCCLNPFETREDIREITAGIQKKFEKLTSLQVSSNCIFKYL
jgi:hypothetical protein